MYFRRKFLFADYGFNRLSKNRRRRYLSSKRKRSVSPKNRRNPRSRFRKWLPTFVRGHRFRVTEYNRLKNLVIALPDPVVSNVNRSLIADGIPSLFMDTVDDSLNISMISDFGDPNVDVEITMSQAQLRGIHDPLDDLPGEYLTNISHRVRKNSNFFNDDVFMNTNKRSHDSFLETNISSGSIPIVYKMDDRGTPQNLSYHHKKD